MPSPATVGAMAEPIVSAVPRPAKHRKSEAPEFPGCRPVHLSRDEVAGYDGRFEYWDRDTEVAMVCEPTSYYHERPAQRLARLVQTIAHVRGTPIEAVGATDLLVRNARGERQRIMQADQILFLRAVETVPRGHAIEVGVDALPDVVLEVDHTTDVRRGKLSLYESWGFPEVWVEVPDEAAPSRPASRRSGLTIHVLGDEGLRTAPSSRAFSGWSAEEIHRAERAGVIRGTETGKPRRCCAGWAGRWAGWKARDRMMIRCCVKNAGRVASRAGGKAVLHTAVREIFAAVTGGAFPSRTTAASSTVRHGSRDGMRRGWRRSETWTPVRLYESWKCGWRYRTRRPRVARHPGAGGVGVSGRDRMEDFLRLARRSH